MKRLAQTGILALTVAGSSLIVAETDAAVFRYRLSGNWTTVTDGVGEGWGLNPNNNGSPGIGLPGGADDARINWGGNTVTVDSAVAAVDRVQIGVDESGGLERSIEQITESILIDGVRSGATDIHLHPGEKVTRIRYRLDGVLRQVEVIPRSITNAINSRIKILSQLDIAERRLPQDGRFNMFFNDMTGKLTGEDHAGAHAVSDEKQGLGLMQRVHAGAAEIVAVDPHAAGLGVDHLELDASIGETTGEHPEALIDGTAVQHLGHDLDVGCVEEGEVAGVAVDDVTFASEFDTVRRGQLASGVESEAHLDAEAVTDQAQRCRRR